VYISEFQLTNYKSYYSTEALKLFLGINVVVGPNHVGKTALLEGLSLSFPSKPSRSSKIRRHAGSAKPSSAVVSFTVGYDELMQILGGMRSPFAVPLPSKEKIINLEMLPEIQHVLRFLDGVFNKDEFTFQVCVESGGDEELIKHVSFPVWGRYQGRWLP
jgi:hypothetical protein